MDPQVFAGSKPEKRAKDARDGSLAHFVYTKDGDNGGIIYWLGTRRCVRERERERESKRGRLGGRFTTTMPWLLCGVAPATRACCRTAPAAP